MGFISVNAALALLLFLSTFWLFFSYGATDIALSEPYDELIPVLMMAPFLGCPIFIYALKNRSSRVLAAVKLVLIITVCSVHVIHLIIVGMNPVFSSRWTWQYNDLRELNYIVPSLKMIACTGTLCLFFLFCQEFLDARSESGKKPKKNDFLRGLGVIFLGAAGFGVIQEICAVQPLWISLTIFAWIGVTLCLFILLDCLHTWRGIKTEQINAGPIKPAVDGFVLKGLPLRERMRIRSSRNAIIFGLVLWCVFISFYPAQLVFQEGPTNAWGMSVIVGSATAILLMVIWWQARLTAIRAFFTVAIVTAISPVLLVTGWAIIPGTVPVAQILSLMGLISTLAWILFYGIKNQERWPTRLTLLSAWICFVMLVIFFHDPLLEFWEIEEAFLDLQQEAGMVTDPLGTGVGLGYLFQFYLVLVGLGITGIILVVRELKRRSRPSRSSSPSPTPSSKPVPPSLSRATSSGSTTVKLQKRQLQASIVIFIAVLGSALVFTGVNNTKNPPVVVAEMGNHGVLWLANSYDRVLPDYHPDFTWSPRNSTIDVHAMIGEVEFVQLVFSPVASKMISFQGYQWSSPGGSLNDTLWKEEGGSLVQIPITTGRVGYIDCFDSNIADVLLPWTSFITGSNSRENIPFWMEISVPRNVTAGIYTTHFEYLTTSYLQRVARTVSLNFTLQLTVWNATKPLNRTLDTCVGLRPELPQNAETLQKLAIKYGADPYSVASPTVTYNPSNLSEGLSIDWTTFDAITQEMLDAGMSHIKLDFYPGIDCRHDAESVVNGSKDNYLTLIEWFYENASLHLAPKLTPWGTTWESETITQHSDEPDPDLEPLAMQAFDILYKIIRNVSSIQSFQTFKYVPAFDELLDCLDIWVLTPDSFTVEVANKIRDAGNEVWTYSNGDNFPGTDTDLRTPLIMSRLRGWVDYHYNISGFLHWVFYWNYNDAGRSGCGYDGRGDGTEIVPYNGGYLPTLRLAAFRDGLDDNELLWMLNKTSTLALASNISSPIVDEAISILHSVDKALDKQLMDNQWAIPVVTREFDHAAPTYINLRLQCGRILDALNGLF